MGEKISIYIDDFQIHAILLPELYSKVSPTTDFCFYRCLRGGCCAVGSEGITILCYRPERSLLAENIINSPNANEI